MSEHPVSRARGERLRRPSALLFGFLAWALMAGLHADAAVVTFGFSISGDNGETGTGTFTYDDTVVAPGQPVAASLTDTGNVIGLSITISGGNVIGGSTTFDETDCVGAFLENAPDFVEDINVWCNNGVNTLSGFSDNINYMNDSVDFGAGLVQPSLGANSSTLTFAPTGAVLTPTPGRVSSIPASPLWSLCLTALLALGVVIRHQTTRPMRRAQATDARRG